MPKAKKDPLKTFASHGVNTENVNGSGQVTADCPFCGKPSHFFIKATTGQYHCKVCGAKGNQYSFLTTVHSMCLEDTNDKAYSELSKNRGLPKVRLKAYDLAYDPVMEHWLIPTRNIDGKLSNLRIWRPGEPTMSTGGCELQLYGIDKLKPKGPIYICEGEWDCMALEHILDANKVRTVSVLAVPGASVFKTDWIKHVSGRQVFLVFDFDSAGIDGMRALTDKLRPHAQNISVIKWPSSSPEKFDVRDFVGLHIKSKTTLRAGWNLLQSFFIGSEKPKPTIQRTTLASVVKDFRKFFHVSKSFESALKIACAVHISRLIPGDPLWLFLVGPPGCGKTLICDSLDDSQYVIARSNLSQASLVSGYPTEDGSDPSLLPLLAGNLFVMKDWTEVMNLPIQVQDMIYSIFRGAYDGKVYVAYGNGIIRDYRNCFFAMLAAVTDVIHERKQAALGERFLKFEMLPRNYDPERQIARAVSNVGRSRDAEEFCRQSIAAFLDRDYNIPKSLRISDSARDRVIALAQVIAYLRAGVSRGYNNILSHRPRIEIATRLAKTLAKLGQCLALVDNSRTVSTENWDLVSKVGFDSAIGWHVDIIHALIQNHPNPLTADEICMKCNIARATFDRRCDDLIDLQAVVHVVPDTDKSKGPTVGKKSYFAKDMVKNKPGRPISQQFLVHKNLLKLWARAKIKASL